MANSSELASWIFQKSVSVPLHIENLLWIKEVFPGVTDVAVHASLSSRNFYGWGSAMDADVALAKAVAELVERIVQAERSFSTSNGMATHLTRQQAIDSATSELIERDLFLCHFLTSTPFARISELDGEIQACVEFFEARGVRSRFFRLGSKGAVCAMDGLDRIDPFGFVLSTAYKESFKESLLATAISAGRRCHRILSGGKVDSLTLEEFLAIEKPTFRDHGRLALNSKHAICLEFLFSGPDSDESIANEKSDFLIEELRPSQFDFADVPLTVVRVQSAALQDLFLGKAKPEVVNLSRLSQFTNKVFEWKQVNLLPHPID